MEEKVFIKGLPVTHRDSGIKFLNEVIEYSKKGYVLDENPTTRRERASFIGFPVCTMVKSDGKQKPVEEKVEEPKPEVENKQQEEEVKVTLDDIESASKKKELLSLAKQMGVEVPKGISVPKAIQKFLKEKLGE